MAGNQAGTLAEFCAVTQASKAQAIPILEACGYQLEAAIELFFAAGPTDIANPPPALHQPEDDEALARRLQQQYVQFISQHLGVDQSIRSLKLI